MKKSLFVRLHIYAGLFTFFYLLFWGFSTILMNHDISVEKKYIAKRWSAKVDLDVQMESQKLAESIRDQLDLMGWVPPWEYKRDSISFRYEVTHPGRKYFINADLNSGNVEISELPKGLLHMLKNHKIAWGILIVGFAYVGAVVGYLYFF